MDEKTAGLVRGISDVIIDQPPARVRRALCDVLGVLISHVISASPEDERSAMLDASMAIIRAEILESYSAFVDWSDKAAH